MKPTIIIVFDIEYAGDIIQRDKKFRKVPNQGGVQAGWFSVVEYIAALYDIRHLSQRPCDNATAACRVEAQVHMYEPTLI